MPCLRTSLCVVTLAWMLAACAATPVESEVVHPYLEDSRAIELQATNSVQLGNYQQASRLYERAYNAYSAIDDRSGMARQLINQAQVSLIVEDLDQARASINALLSHVQLYGQTNLRPRYVLLSANLAIAENRWQDALDFIQQDLATTEPSIRESVQVSRAIADYHLSKDKPASSVGLDDIESPLIRARLARLYAQQAIERDNDERATSHLQIAKALYRTAAFAPGIAECLILEAELLDGQSKSQAALELRRRAKVIFQRLNNQRAIARHNL